MITTHPPGHGTTGTTWSHKKTLTTWTNACATTWTGPQTTWTTKRWRRWYKLANCTNWKVQVHTLYIQFFLGQAVKFAPKDEGFDFCEFKGKRVSIGHCTQCPSGNDTSWWKFISGPDEDDDDQCSPPILTSSWEIWRKWGQQSRTDKTRLLCSQKI